MDKQPSETALNKFFARVPLYARLGFGAIVLFGLLGNCTGHRDGSIVVFVFVSVIWCCNRIITEAFEAYRILLIAKKLDAEQTQAKKDGDKKDPPVPPSGPGTTSGPPTGTSW